VGDVSDPTAVDLVPADSIVPEEPVVIDLAALSVVEAELNDVERALQRLDEGTYGTCEVCQAPLADDQLDAAPAALRCPSHASA
jgi:RNA polymerase-binding transcription factor DksA